jgi:hypothetical protein
MADDPSEKRKQELKAGIDNLLAHDYTLTEIVASSQHQAETAREKGLEADAKRWEELTALAQETLSEQELKAADPPEPVHDELPVGKHRANRVIVPGQKQPTSSPAPRIALPISQLSSSLIRPRPLVLRSKTSAAIRPNSPGGGETTITSIAR